jgi:hypothetical protein
VTEGGKMEASRPADSGSSDHESESKPNEQAAEADMQPEREVFGMYLTVRNEAAHQTVERFEMPLLDGGKKAWAEKPWHIYYTIEEMENEKARTLLKQIKRRRRALFIGAEPEARAQLWRKLFRGQLKNLTEFGRRYRSRISKEDAKRDTVRVVWNKRPVNPETLRVEKRQPSQTERRTSSKSVTKVDRHRERKRLRKERAKECEVPPVEEQMGDTQTGEALSGNSLHGETRSDGFSPSDKGDESKSLATAERAERA